MPVEKRLSTVALIGRALIAALALVGAAALLVTAYLLVRFPSRAPTGPRPLASSAVIESGAACEQRYLALLKLYLTRYDSGERYHKITWHPPGARFLASGLASRGLELVQVHAPDRDLRADGRDWPGTAETMIGLRRLDNLQDCIADVLRRRVPGDLIEAGAWRGGATIFMRAMLKAYNASERTVWVADSFQGLPKSDSEKYPADAGDVHYQLPELAVSLDQVKENFARYGVLDQGVKFLVGWFSDTLPKAPIERLAILRIDADMYQSTMEALRYLYPKLSVGGYVIVDDYGALRTCKNAVDDFRASHGIREEMKSIDWTGVFWQKLQ